ncbi:galactose mutarotase-like protein [Obba rivulosa]|uniref:Galactose mutarotase-like protein n=1 Tax=Obba rivulosa TaxID=1052685 RepID=A0A8E2DL49_9APHY|nr:galactose mutarotase-like protein [Obba rivulosa]
MADHRFTPILLALPSFTPSLALELLPHGLTIHRLFVQADGKTHDILIGPEDPVGHLTQKYTNTVVGRYANRLPVAPAPLSLARGPHTGTLAPLANEAPTVSLHGGPDGFDARVWTPLADIGEAQLFSDAEKGTIAAHVPSAVVCVLESPDGDQGFPGALRVEALVGLVSPAAPPTRGAEKPEWLLGSVLLVYRARLLDADKVTPVNLTQHWGFNLDASLQDGPVSVADHRIAIKASHTLDLTPDALSAGTLSALEGPHAPLAAQGGTRIGDHPYDNFYLFEPVPPAAMATTARSIAAQPTRLAPDEFSPITDLLAPVLEQGQGAGAAPETGAEDPQVELEGARSGLRVTFWSNQPGVQFYTNKFANAEKSARKRIHGGSGAVGDGYGSGSAAFLEFHAPLAAWLHPATRPAAVRAAAQGAAAPAGADDDTLLAPGELYHNVVRTDVWFRSPDGL